nr:MAG TPA_asm: hypothetical protein [Bacteriophage sp.]
MPVSVTAEPFIYSVRIRRTPLSIKIMKIKMNVLESMQESNLLTIPFISGRLYRLTNRL